MALITLKVYSESLGKQTEISVIIPQSRNSGQIGVENKSAKKYKCLYLLHGLSDDNSIWMRLTSIERYASRYGLAVIMPNADKSFYTDIPNLGNYYTYIAKELPSIIREYLPISEKREDNFVGGLSMGGYGALKVGLREYDSFSKIISLSPCGDIKKRMLVSDAVKAVFGEDMNVPNEDDVLYLAEKCENKPKIFMAIGTEDFLYENNKPVRKKFEDLNYDFTYYEQEGSHSWDFWDKYIEKAVDWLYE